MAARKPTAPRPVVQVQVARVRDERTRQAMTVLEGAVQRLQGGQASRSRYVIHNVDLVIGTNKLTHKLGRSVAGYTLTLKTADLGFGHALDEDNPNPEREVWIEVVGNDAARVTIEVY